eukprot:366535-Chlamydomonas_euryale.AAC.6
MVAPSHLARPVPIKCGVGQPHHARWDLTWSQYLQRDVVLAGLLRVWMRTKCGRVGEDLQGSVRRDLLCQRDQCGRVGEDLQASVRRDLLCQKDQGQHMEAAVA